MYILVTGGAGFIGSNFIIYMLNKYPHYKIVNLDKLTYAGNLKNLKEVENHPNYEFVKGDICNRELVEYLFEKYNFQGVFHFAAESHVDNSIKNPSTFIETNVNGTFTVLDVARHHWMDAPSKMKKKFVNARFHHISTDEVFGSLSNIGYFTEESPYAPNSPYSSSKASSDMIVRSYFHTYGMNVVITNCSNNFGPRQHDEKLIPTIIRKALAGEPIPIYGNGMNVRDWLYVEDHCQAIDTVFHKATLGELYVVGGNCEKNNLQIVNEICGLLDELDFKRLTALGLGTFRQLITFVDDRVGHDFRYAIDASKLIDSLNWKIEGDFKDKIRQTVEYYMCEYT